MQISSENDDIFISVKFSSLAALEVVKMTTLSAASDEYFIKMKFSFQCIARLRYLHCYHTVDTAVLH